MQRITVKSGNAGAIFGDFLPDFKSPAILLGVVLIGELLGLVLTVAGAGVVPFDWHRFGLLSFFIQWVSLSSAAAIIPLQQRLNRMSAAVAGSLCFILVQLMTLLYSLLSANLLGASLTISTATIVQNLLISAIFSGIGLRYMYLQQLLRNQHKAQLQAQLQALQSRIQPHFLFNSMNSIASLIAVDPEKAERMVEDLSDLFRANLAEPGLVTVAEELALCERYLAIEKIRLDERLQVAWQCTEGVKKQLIPRLLLQPLLENAIKHGIHPRPQGGRVEIILHNDDLNLYLSVSNPVDANNAAEKGNQLALNNVVARLEAHFGERSICEIEHRDNQFTVNIRYRLKKTQDCADSS